MFRSRFAVAFVAVAALCFVLAAASLPDARAGLPKLTDKLKQKAKEKVEAKADAVLSGEQAPAPADQEPPADEGDKAGQPDGAPASTSVAGRAGAAGAAADMALYTKYDFVPGDRTIFCDDLAGDPVGEFPHRWRLDDGVFEVAKLAGETWILNTNKGSIRPDIADGLPQRYTIEMEIWDGGPDTKGHWHFIRWVDAEGQEIGDFALKDHQNTYFNLAGDQKANKALPQPLAKGRHTMRAMVTPSTIKCYVDNERVANIPKVAGWAPVGLRVTLDPWDDAEAPLVIRGFRLAEGGKTLQDQLAETGRIVTHGILFDSGSAVIKGESYKTLSLIAELLTDPALKLSIEGHTDSDGADDANLTLSQKRADAVKGWLVAQGTAADRLQTKGFGESKPLDANATPEGKANNRRVELVKLSG
jgi:outer membrane protein OmpA-like peptidoglycan-associated protein